MKQNKYDDPDFFDKYRQMPRSVGGLDAAHEWGAFRAMLPDLQGQRVLDLGCGFGWHCRYARQQGAASVVGVDISEKMLARAREMTEDPAIQYIQAAIEDIDFPAESFDVAISSLAIHYVERFDLVCRAVRQCLTVGGAFVLSVEHPTFTAVATQNWSLGPSGERLHWPVDDYQQETIRHTQWLAPDVVKYHRTFATYLNTLIDEGFQISRLSEAPVTAEDIAQNPGLKDDRRRPTFLLIAAVKDTLP
ncbi:methyltransferase [Capsulimonas corticalis]|uniref:Methyltransferase n=1 Tax=Capsulimonas corticalis TaxID=2219043 RepID=A0A402D296_9BACT|nr:class I SAM-dependent methyltransferase [Capsulimonas corticalis]BDI30162.1 methyltransferase [Capsulimonas corticalis]